MASSEQKNTTDLYSTKLSKQHNNVNKDTDSLKASLHEDLPRQVRQQFRLIERDKAQHATSKNEMRNSPTRLTMQQVVKL